MAMTFNPSLHLEKNSFHRCHRRSDCDTFGIVVERPVAEARCSNLANVSLYLHLTLEFDKDKCIEVVICLQRNIFFIFFHMFKQIKQVL